MTVITSAAAFNTKTTRSPPNGAQHDIGTGSTRRRQTQHHSLLTFHQELNNFPHYLLLGLPRVRRTSPSHQLGREGSGGGDGGKSLVASRSHESDLLADNAKSVWIPDYPALGAGGVASRFRNRSSNVVKFTILHHAGRCSALALRALDALFARYSSPEKEEAAERDGVPRGMLLRDFCGCCR